MTQPNMVRPSPQMMPMQQQGRPMVMQNVSSIPPSMHPQQYQQQMQRLQQQTQVNTQTKPQQPRQQTQEQSSRTDDSTLPVKPASNSDIPQYDGADDQNEDDTELRSDLDDTDDDVLNGEDREDDCPNFILCQYERVQRTRERWRCTLKAGVMHIGNCDFAFNKATTEFRW